MGFIAKARAVTNDPCFLTYSYGVYVCKYILYRVTEYMSSGSEMRSGGVGNSNSNFFTLCAHAH